MHEMWKRWRFFSTDHPCDSPIKKVQPKAFHSCRAIVAEWTRLDHVVLANVFVLKVCAHRNLSLETAVTYRAMVWQSFRMRREMLRKMVLPKESLLAYPTFVRLHARMPHLKDKRGVRRVKCSQISDTVNIRARHPGMTSPCDLALVYEGTQRRDKSTVDGENLQL